MDAAEGGARMGAHKTALANVKPREPAGLKELLERFSKDNLKKNRWRLFVEQLPTTELQPSRPK